jgi:hypothetical protein
MRLLVVIALCVWGTGAPLVLSQAGQRCFDSRFAAEQAVEGLKSHKRERAAVRRLLIDARDYQNTMTDCMYDHCYVLSELVRQRVTEYDGFWSSFIPSSTAERAVDALTDIPSSNLMNPDSVVCEQLEELVKIEKSKLADKASDQFPTWSFGRVLEFFSILAKLF